ncbi:MAG: TIGR00266 family protein [Planctomycetota bacterium]
MAQASDVIDYKIIGDDMQAVIVTLDPNEQVLAEAGAMLFMTAGIEMQTSMSTDKSKGFLGNLLKAAGRAITGESFFITTFTNNGKARADVGFAAPYPGRIIPLELGKLGGTMICQKDAFLCAARGTDVTIAFQKKFGVGLFGGEGFILQKLTGDGLAFIHAGGTVFKKTLGPGETIRVDTGCIVGFMPTVNYEIQFVGGFKNALFGGEGLFFATLTGPGETYLQTLPLSRLAGRIAGAAFRGGKDEGSVIGGLGSLFKSGD